MDQYFKKMEELSQKKDLASRLRFMLQDIIELRQNDWIPRRKEEKAKNS